MVTVIRGNSRMATRKDMEHLSGLVDRDTSGSGCRISNTGMEYTDGQMEESIMDSGNRIITMDTDILSLQMD